MSMCRLFGLRANEPTRVECSLVEAQNALMTQSQGDREGLVHAHGWGVADYSDGLPYVEKQSWASWHGEHFRKAAARIYAMTVIAHVRRATIGPPGIENTHPFVHGTWLFAHNGTIPRFEEVRMQLLEAMAPLHRNEIHGTTDSEHLFRYLLSLWQHHPERPLAETLQSGLNQVCAWVWEHDPDLRPGLNVLWTNGVDFVGSRLDRTLWMLERNDVFHCPMCGKSHVHHAPKTQYRSVEVASEPISSEAWREVPNGSVFSVNGDLGLELFPLTSDFHQM
jgi:glutamine amidotransferase